MSGYNGFSMSNNAIEAYQGGEKPLTKWTKTNIIRAVENYIKENEVNFTLETLKTLPVDSLKRLVLKTSSWHHTSYHYNRTDFYGLNESRLEEFTDDDIKKIKENSKVKVIVEEVTVNCIGSWVEWVGRFKNYRKPVEVNKSGYIKGNWFYAVDGSKKSIDGNSFSFKEVENDNS